MSDTPPPPSGLKGTDEFSALLEDPEFPTGAALVLLDPRELLSLLQAANQLNDQAPRQADFVYRHVSSTGGVVLTKIAREIAGEQGKNVNGAMPGGIPQTLEDGSLRYEVELGEIKETEITARKAALVASLSKQYPELTINADYPDRMLSKADGSYTWYQIRIQITVNPGVFLQNPRYTKFIESIEPATARTDEILVRTVELRREKAKAAMVALQEQLDAYDMAMIRAAYAVLVARIQSELEPEIAAQILENIQLWKEDSRIRGGVQEVAMIMVEDLPEKVRMNDGTSRNTSFVLQGFSESNEWLCDEAIVNDGKLEMRIDVPFREIPGTQAHQEYQAVLTHMETATTMIHEAIDASVDSEDHRNRLKAAKTRGLEIVEGKFDEVFDTLLITITNIPGDNPEEVAQSCVEALNDDVRGRRTWYPCYGLAGQKGVELRIPLTQIEGRVVQ